jgi:hypothetical protein
MKKLIVGFIAGAIFASGIASAATAYWEDRGKTYSCQGTAVSVFCKETNWRPAYGVSIIPGQIDITYRGKIIADCDRGHTPAYNCYLAVPSR